jgi:fibro-slime domain-containing protein
MAQAKAALAIALIATLATTWALLAPPDAVPEGLVGRYFATADWSGEPFLERVDLLPSTETLAGTSELTGRDRFSVEWTGTLIIRRDAIHRFATKSDDGTWLWIDDQLVIDNGGTHSARNVWTDVPLKRGAYPFKLRYSQTGGDYFLQLGQTGLAGLMVQPGPLVPGTLSYDELRRRELWPLLMVVVWYCAVVVGVTAALARGRHLPVLRDVAAIWADLPARAIVLVGMALSAAHIAYGVPAVPAFSVDELEPLDTLIASQSGFQGWNLRWPPFHAFVIALTLQPFRWAEAVFQLPLHDDVVVGAMFLVIRGLSVVFVGLTLLLTFDGARMVAGRRAGYFAAALLATCPLVVYFGSLANLEIPHLFWVTLTFWVWLQLWQQRQPYWFAALGTAVGFSLAAKDQSYGYYVLAPFALVFLVVRDRRSRGDRSWLRALGDRRLLLTAVSTLVAMAIGHALPWRLDRFVERLTVMGPLSAQYQLFDPSFEGYMALLVATAKSFWWAAGTPLVVAMLIGLVGAVRGRRVGAAVVTAGVAGGVLR